jgi:hypothetical protein
VQLEVATAWIAALARDWGKDTSTFGKQPSSDSPYRKPVRQSYLSAAINCGENALNLRSLLCQVEGNLRHGLVLGRRQVRVGGRRPDSFKGVAGTE